MENNKTNEFEGTLLNIKFNESINRENNFYMIGEDNIKNTHYLVRLVEEEPDKVVNDTAFIKYYNFVMIEDEKYEAIEITNLYGKNFSRRLLMTMTELDLDLASSIKKIETILKSLFNGIDKLTARGIFGELASMKQFHLIPNIDPSSIYDFKNDDGIDIEVKSYSKIKREAHISYQQLTNSENARFYFVEVVESREGISILDLAKELNLENCERYDWIFHSESKWVNQEFKALSFSSEMAVNLSKGLSLPELSKDAKFIFDIPKFDDK